MRHGESGTCKMSATRKSEAGSRRGPDCASRASADNCENHHAEAFPSPAGVSSLPCASDETRPAPAGNCAGYKPKLRGPSPGAPEISEPTSLLFLSLPLRYLCYLL